MAVIVPGGEDSSLFRFLRHNLPETFFEKGPVFCLSADYVPGLPRDTVYLADSAALGDKDEPPHFITCGYSPKDTFTFSSKEEERACVALMRTVSTPLGAVDPMEIPVEFPAGTEEFAVLGAAAIRMLSGDIPKKVLCFTLPDMDSPPNRDGQNLNK